MSKITRKVNSITCICGYVRTYLTCDLVITGTITKDIYPGNCEMCHQEVNKQEYYNC